MRQYFSQAQLNILCIEMSAPLRHGGHLLQQTPGEREGQRRKKKEQEKETPRDQLSLRIRVKIALSNYTDA